MTFGPFRLETTQARLWRGEQVIPLRRRTFAMLRYLAEHPGRLVTKAELRQHLWAGTHVTDTVLRVCIREIRAALGDVAEAPQYLQTGQWAGVSVARAGRRRCRPAGWCTAHHCGAPAEVDALEGWFQRAAKATASSSSSVASGDWQDDGAGPVADPPGRQEHRCGSDGASAPSTMGKRNPTCPSWTLGASSATDQRGRSSWRCCGGMRPCG